jgi:hypothetical protein
MVVGAPEEDHGGSKMEDGKTATLWAGGHISINLSFFPFGGSFCCYECEIDAKNESEP